MEVTVDTLNEKGKKTGWKSVSLKQLAQDIIDRKVFGSWDVTIPRDIKHIFLNLSSFVEGRTPKELDEVKGVYEYRRYALKDCGFRGMPMFRRCNMLDKVSKARLLDVLSKMRNNVPIDEGDSIKKPVYANENIIVIC